MKSLLSFYISLLLITISFCDDCSSKAEKDCTGSCKWTATAASCAVATCALKSDSSACEDNTNCDFTAADTTNNTPAKCEAKTNSCALNDGKTACTPTAGCTYTAASGKCAASSSSDESSAFSLKNSFIIYLLSFLF